MRAHVSSQWPVRLRAAANGCRLALPLAAYYPGSERDAHEFNIWAEGWLGRSLLALVVIVSLVLVLSVGLGFLSAWLWRRFTGRKTSRVWFILAALLAGACLLVFGWQVLAVVVFLAGHPDAF